MMFHEALKQARKQMKIKQDELSRTLHVTTTTISRWESGRVTPTPLARSVLIDLCKTNKVDANIIEDLKEKR